MIRIFKLDRRSVSLLQFFFPNIPHYCMQKQSRTSPQCIFTEKLHVWSCWLDQVSSLLSWTLLTAWGVIVNHRIASDFQGPCRGANDCDFCLVLNFFFSKRMPVDSSHWWWTVFSFDSNRRSASLSSGIFRGDCWVYLPYLQDRHPPHCWFAIHSIRCGAGQRQYYNNIPKTK